MPDLMQAPLLLREPRAGKSRFLASSTDLETFRELCFSSLTGELQPFEMCFSLLSREQGFAAVPGWDGPAAASIHVLVLPPTRLGQHRMGPAARTPLPALFRHTESRVPGATESAGASHGKAAFPLGKAKEGWVPSTSSG